jgi:hypothetical protein
MHLARVLTLASVVAAGFVPADVFAQPCLADAPRAKRVRQQNWTRSDDDTKQLTVRWRMDDCELRVDAEGEFTPRADLSGFLTISRGGYVEVEERDGEHRRKVRVSNGAAGLQYRWTLDGDERFDVDRERWLASMLLALERRTAMFAKVRVPELLRQGGPSAVLSEATLLQSDHARRIYYTALLSTVRLDEATTERLLRDAGESMASDYERAELLRAVSQHGPMTDRVTRAIIRTAQDMASDYEKRRALSSALESVSSRESRAALFMAASSMRSSYELAELLIAAQRRSLVDSASGAAYFGAVEKLSSDYERRRTLSALLRQRPEASVVLAGILRASSSISSDYELATLLIEFARVVPVRGEIRELYLKATRSISSDHEYRRVLQALLDQDRQI